MKAGIIPGILALTLALPSCLGPRQLEEQLDRMAEGGATISFEPLGTRSTMLEDGDFYDSFGVTGHSFTDGWSETSAPDLMHNLEVTRESGWTTSCRWPGGKRKARFFAYAPYNAVGVSLSGMDEEGSPRLSYSVPLEVEEQTDIVVASTGELSGAASSVAQLSFQHILTAVRFVCGQDIKPGTVRRVALKGICSEGVYGFGTGCWTGVVDTTSFVVAVDAAVSGQGDLIAGGDKTFLLLPQSLPEGAQIEVVLDDGEEEHILSSSIAGTEWLPGTTVVYSISSDSINLCYTFEVSSPDHCGHEGGVASFEFQSWSSTLSDTLSKTALGWTAEFVELGEDGDYFVVPAPDWISGLSLEFNGTEVSSSVSAVVAPQTVMAVNHHDEALRDAQEVEGTFDLSTKGGSSPRRTANCYVVNAPGRYKLPLVYGNAIDYVKNPVDGDNLPSRHLDASDVTEQFSPPLLYDLINHLGNPITSPHIADNTDCVPHEAIVVWQDAPDLVSEPSVSDGFLYFTVDRGTIKQGNAVLAVRDAGGTVMWSWHIWVTDRILEDGTTNLHYEFYYPDYDELFTYDSFYLDVPLGWCDNDEDYFAPRATSVRFTQKESGLSVVREIVQDAGDSGRPTEGSCPYYQWGRKDPFRPSEGCLSNVDKQVWSGSGVPIAGPGVETWNCDDSAITNSIQKPTVLNSNPRMDGSYTNLWNIYSGIPHNDGEGKTIYDPSPPGYRLPRSELFGFFYLNGLSNAEDYGGVWDGIRRGYHVPASPKDLFIHQMGYRSPSTGELMDVGELGVYWSNKGYEYEVETSGLNILTSLEERTGFLDEISDGVDRALACPVLVKLDL